MNTITGSINSGFQTRASRRASRWSWLWLAIGAILLPFSLFQTVVPIAAWLAPVFLLRFTRSQRAIIALPVVGIVGYVSVLIATRGAFPSPAAYLFALMGLTNVIVYGADKLLAPRLRGVLRTLVFPLAEGALTFITSNGEYGTFGASAYTQAGNLPLMQIVSVTGIWGLNFLIAWLAPVINELWEKSFDLHAVRASAGLFAGVLVAALLFGGARLAFSPPDALTVRLAMLAPDRALNDTLVAAQIPQHPRTKAEQSAFAEQVLNPILDDLFDRTQQAARGGAKIIAWSEAAGFLFKEDEVALIERARAVARQEGIYLQLGLILYLPTDRFPFVENRAILIDPDGAILWDYPKFTRPLGDSNAPGPGIVPIADTPYGRLATVICYDADFPGLVRQAGRGSADILLVPSSDWEPVAEMHSRMSVFRAIENGLALVRPTRQGTSLAVDHQGRMLGYKADYFIAEDQTLMVNVPRKGSATIYARSGDVLAYLILVGLVTLAGLAFFPQLTKRQADVAGDPA